MTARPILTVFTPTYNRAYTLHLCYESLKRQTCRDFQWLIIDDGSTDETRFLVKGWISEGLVPIRYHYQENQGMHGAHNAAYELVDTELNVCIDSDDYMADDAVEKIVACWRQYGHDGVAGIVALDAAPDGTIIGTRMPKGVSHSTLTDLYAKHKAKGDKKLVYRSDLTRKHPPYPQFAGEKYCPLSYKYILIDQECPLIVMDEVLCHVEYRTDGSSLNMLKQYVRNPRGFSFFRKTAMALAPSFKEKFRESVHYVSSSLLIRNRGFISDSPCRWVTLMAIPFGLMLYLFILYKNRKLLLKTNV